MRFRWCIIRKVCSNGFKGAKKDFVCVGVTSGALRI